MTEAGSPGILPGDTPLRCAEGVVIRTRSDATCDVELDGRCVRAGRFALPVLSAFTVARTPQDAISLLSADLVGTQGAIDLMTTVAQLTDLGALVPDEPRGSFVATARGEGFGAAAIHVAMLGDSQRTNAWLSAVRSAVRPGDVVVDLGTGTGVLAVAAALAGAKRVYAIEAAGCAGVAAALARANGVGDRVDVVRGWSTAVELPELADVLITEILDDDPFREGILEATGDATRRLLRQGALLVPERIRLYATLVEIENDERDRYTFTSHAVGEWRARYGLDFSALVDSLGAGVIRFVPRTHAARWRRLSLPTLLASVGLGASAPTTLDVQVSVSASTAGSCHGVAIHFEADLGGGTTVSTEATRDDGATHWLIPTLILTRAVEVRAGQPQIVRYRYPGMPALELVG